MEPERWKKINEIFQSVVECGISEQTAFLKQACAGDEALRQEVDELLVDQKAAEHFMNALALGVAANPLSSYSPAPPLQIGEQIAQYSLVAKVGAGGMGIVYEALDTRLQRSVALKFLSEEFARNRELRARFEREARVLASLTHPHIASIYGLEESGGRSFLVMELVQGETLAARLAFGAILLDDALGIARQVAEALEAAHEKGVMHRDLKPANVMVTPAGQVKVLDFGLAKAWSKGEVNDSTSNPQRTPETRTGIIFGTVGYMSPEQAKGLATDHRTDIFAFGCLLYEMLTGRQAFAGETVAEIMAAQLTAEPEWDRLPGGTPEAIRRVLRRSLQKDRTRRLQNIADARIEIEDAGTEPDVSEQVLSGRKSRPGKLAGILAFLAIAAAGVFALFYFRTPAEAPEMRLEITTPSTNNSATFTISPDGLKLVFVASGDGQTRLWLRPLASTNPQPLAGTEGASYPFWDPENRSVAFFADGSLKRIEIAGGPPRTLARVARGRGGTWGPDGTIVFADGGNALFRVLQSGGAVEPLTKLEPGHGSHRFPQFLPDGRRFLFYAAGRDQGIYLGSLDSVEIKRLTAEADTAGAYAPQGWLLFVRQGKLVAQRFDTSHGELTGNPETVADSVTFDGNTASGAFSVSATGVLTYRVGMPSSRQLTWYNPSGKPLGNWGDADAENLSGPEISPDGREVLVSRTFEANTDVFRIDVTGRRTRLTLHAQSDSQAVWSRDGTEIAFSSTRNGNSDLFQKLSSGTGGENEIWRTAEEEILNAWSRDGRFLLYSVRPRTALADVWALPMGEERKPIPIANTPFVDERNGKFSPNGRWVTYQSDESGIFQIYVKPFPVRPGKWPVSKDGGFAARWSNDGKEIYYISPNAELMAVRIAEIGDTIEVGTPRTLFQTRIFGGGTSRLSSHQYDVASDGRFLINDTVDYMATSPITVVLNWKPPPW